MSATGKTSSRRKLHQFLLLGTLASAVLATFLYVFWWLNPIGYRSMIFQPVRELNFYVRELDALTDWRSIDKVVVVEPESIRISAPRPHGVEIAAGVYRPKGSTAPAPALVLLHGSYPWGRKAGLIRLLASRLAQDGFFVVAPDARGFGESADPAKIDNPESWRTAQDLGAIIDYLIGTGLVDLNNIFVLGHSMGANHALEGGLTDPRVKALVLIGPGRFTQQEDILLPDWELARFSADRKLKRLVDPEAALFAYSLGNLRLLANTTLARTDHKPILLIDGENEGPIKLQYTAKIVANLKGPIEYHTLVDTGHYCGVRSFYGSETIYVQPRMFLPLYDLLLDFLTRHLAEEEAAATDRRTSQ